MVRIKYWIVLLLTLCVMAACTDNPSGNEGLAVELFGVSSDPVTGEPTFVQGIPAFAGATLVRMRVTQPALGKILQSQTVTLTSNSIAIEDIEYGIGLRLDVEILDANEFVLATGATPTFDYNEGDNARALRVMVMPINSFSAVGSVELDSTTNQRKYVNSRFDYRSVIQQEQQPWLGRVGHTALPTSDGRVLIVGGADVIPGSAPGTIPKFRRVHNDVQVFDPTTGYFTDLSYREVGGVAVSSMEDKLSASRAFHTVTPIGQDRYIVAGGYTVLADQSRPVRTVEIIDLNAADGQRVKPLTDLSGLQVELSQPRGFHEAVYRSQGNQILLIGGIGSSSEDILDSVDLINLDTLTVQSRVATLSAPRTEHRTLLLGDGTVWVIGGRNMQSALKTTELLTISDVSISSSEGPIMNEPRYGFGTAVINKDGNASVVVVGGFTSLAGDVSASYEIGIKGRSEFSANATWTVNEARGGLAAVKLPNSGDILVLGGQNKGGDTIAKAERLVFNGLSAALPYQPVSENLGSFLTPRFGASTTLISSGRILLTGGIGVINTNGGEVIIALDNAEFYNPNDPVAAGRFIP